MATIGNSHAVHILFFQICHVYKRHASRVETEKEHVAGVIYRASSQEFLIFYLPDDRLRNSSFYGFLSKDSD